MKRNEGVAKRDEEGKRVGKERRRGVKKEKIESKMNEDNRDEEE
jgi:hypothetical protein